MITLDEMSISAEESGLLFSSSEYPGHASLPGLTPMDDPNDRYKIVALHDALLKEKVEKLRSSYVEQDGSISILPMVNIKKVLTLFEEGTT